MRSWRGVSNKVSGECLSLCWLSLHLCFSHLVNLSDLQDVVRTEFVCLNEQSSLHHQLTAPNTQDISENEFISNARLAKHSQEAVDTTVCDTPVKSVSNCTLITWGVSVIANTSQNWWGPEACSCSVQRERQHWSHWNDALFSWTLILAVYKAKHFSSLHYINPASLHSLALASTLLLPCVNGLSCQ